MISSPAQQSAKRQETEMSTLMITARTQGISFNEASAVAPFAVVEKLAAMTGALLTSIGMIGGHPVPALRAVRA